MATFGVDVRLVLLLSLASSMCIADVNVLFVGNSLTSVHNLPGMLDALTKSPGSVIRTRSESSTAGGSELSQHAGIPGLDTIDIATVAKIRIGPSTGGHWDFVAFQEQSMSWNYYEPETYGTYGFTRVDEYGRHYVQLYLDILTNESRAVGATPIFFMTQDPEDYSGPCNDTNSSEFGCLTPLTWEDQKFVDAAYSYAAGMTKSLCAPCGNAAVANVASFGESAVYQDDVHPTEMTQYTNACVFYAALTGKSPVGLNNAGTSFTEDLTLVQQHAWSAYTDYKIRRLPECNATRCVRFINPDDGTLNVVPTFSPTVPRFTKPPTIMVLPGEKCEATPDLNKSGFATLIDSSVLTPTILQSPSAAELLRKVGIACPSTWTKCYSGTRDGWDAYKFHALCDFRGPTLTVVKAGTRIFGGFAPVSWGDRDKGLEAEGAWLFRIAPGSSGSNSAFQFVDLISDSMKVMHDEEHDCIYLGKQEDLHLGSDCRVSSGTAAYDKYVDPPTGYNDTWLAGHATYVASHVEIFVTFNLEGNVTKAFGCDGSCSKLGIDEHGDCSCQKECLLQFNCCSDWDDEKCFGPLKTHSPTTVGTTTTKPTQAQTTTTSPTQRPTTSTPTRKGDTPSPTQVQTTMLTTTQMKTTVKPTHIQTTVSPTQAQATTKPTRSGDTPAPSQPHVTSATKTIRPSTAAPTGYPTEIHKTTPPTHTHTTHTTHTRAPALANKTSPSSSSNLMVYILVPVGVIILVVAIVLFCKGSAIAANRRARENKSTGRYAQVHNNTFPHHDHDGINNEDDMYEEETDA